MDHKEKILENLSKVVVRSRRMSRMVHHCPLYLYLEVYHWWKSDCMGSNTNSLQAGTGLGRHKFKDLGEKKQVDGSILKGY